MSIGRGRVDGGISMVAGGAPVSFVDDGGGFGEDETARSDAPPPPPQPASRLSSRGVNQIGRQQAGFRLRDMADVS